MARPKDDPLTASHYQMNHRVSSFAPLSLVSTAELTAVLGIPKDATPEVAAKIKAEGLKRLLDLGAITPAEAPEPDPAVVSEPLTFANPPTPPPPPKK